MTYLPLRSKDRLVELPGQLRVDVSQHFRGMHWRSAPTGISVEISNASEAPTRSKFTRVGHHNNPLITVLTTSELTTRKMCLYHWLEWSKSHATAWQGSTGQVSHSTIARPAFSSPLLLLTMLPSLLVCLRVMSLYA